MSDVDILIYLALVVIGILLFATRHFPAAVTLALAMAIIYLSS